MEKFSVTHWLQTKSELHCFLISLHSSQMKYILCNDSVEYLSGWKRSPPAPNKLSVYVPIFQRVLQLNYSQPNWSRKLSKDAINKPAWKNTFGSGGKKRTVV